MADKEDVAMFRDSIQNVIAFEIIELKSDNSTKNGTWGHFDFMFAKSAGKLVYSHILDTMAALDEEESQEISSSRRFQLDFQLLAIGVALKMIAF